MKAGAAKERAELERTEEAASIVPPPSRLRREMVGFMEGMVAAGIHDRPVSDVWIDTLERVLISSGSKFKQ